MTTHLSDRHAPRPSNAPRGTSLWRAIARLVASGRSRTDVLLACQPEQTEIAMAYLDALLGEV
jgi:hypothetical protein